MNYTSNDQKKEPFHLSLELLNEDKEIVKEEVPIVEQVNENFSQNLLNLIINNDKTKNLVDIPLSESEINILKEIISKSPSCLDDINKCILEIIKDGKIDVMDIPPFITIIKNIYILCHQQINIKVSDLVVSIGSILKYILEIVLVKNNLLSPELLQSCNGLIDIVVDMIKLKSSLKTKSCFFKLC
jgi:hypothetical protein